MDHGLVPGLRVSAAQARRIALAAQGFGRSHTGPVNQGHLRRTVDRLGLHQIDSVNVLVRAHYLPAFSRLGGYDRALLDRAAWGRRSERRLFEYWAHEASLLPLDLHPLLRWRMARAERGEVGWTGLRAFAGDRRGEAEALLAQIRDQGPMTNGTLKGKRGAPCFRPVQKESMFTWPRRRLPIRDVRRAPAGLLEQGLGQAKARRTYAQQPWRVGTRRAYTPSRQGHIETEANLSAA